MSGRAEEVVSPWNSDERGIGGGRCQPSCFVDRHDRVGAGFHHQDRDFKVGCGPDDIVTIEVGLERRADRERSAPYMNFHITVVTNRRVAEQMTHMGHIRRRRHTDQRSDGVEATGGEYRGCPAEAVTYEQAGPCSSFQQGDRSPCEVAYLRTDRRG